MQTLFLLILVALPWAIAWFMRSLFYFSPKEITEAEPEKASRLKYANKINNYVGVGGAILIAVSYYAMLVLTESIIVDLVIIANILLFVFYGLGKPIKRVPVNYHRDYKYKEKTSSLKGIVRESKQELQEERNLRRGMKYAVRKGR